MTVPAAEEWQNRLRVELRWSDFDRFGHLNHAVYPVLLAEGRMAVMGSLLGEGAMEFVLVRVELDYRREVGLSEDHLFVASRVAEVGTKSVTLEHQLLLADQAVVAESRAVVVAWDGAARSARELHAEERGALVPGAQLRRSQGAGNVGSGRR